MNLMVNVLGGNCIGNFYISFFQPFTNILDVCRKTERTSVVKSDVFFFTFVYNENRSRVERFDFRQFIIINAEIFRHR